jgi:hypothetical protein
VIRPNLIIRSAIRLRTLSGIIGAVQLPEGSIESVAEELGANIIKNSADGNPTRGEPISMFIDFRLIVGWSCDTLAEHLSAVTAC